MAKDRISEAIQQAISQGIFPGAVILCAVNQKIIFHESYGMADVFKKRKMRICKICKKYTLKETHCQEKTKKAGYKYLKIHKNLDDSQKI